MLHEFLCPDGSILFFFIYFIFEIVCSWIDHSHTHSHINAYDEHWELIVNSAILSRRPRARNYKIVHSFSLFLSYQLLCTLYYVLVYSIWKSINSKMRMHAFHLPFLDLRFALIFCVFFRSFVFSNTCLPEGSPHAFGMR